jgi:hypothetical protein
MIDRLAYAIAEHCVDTRAAIDGYYPVARV